MFKIVVSGHGEFASSIDKTLEYIIGKQSNIEFINFNDGMGTKELEEKYRLCIENNDTQGILFLTDLAGGTPFSTAVTMTESLKDAYVLGGINIPIVLAAIEHRDESGLKDSVDEIINYGKDSLIKFEKRELNMSDESLDGI